VLSRTRCTSRDDHVTSPDERRVGRLMSGWVADETNTRRFPMT